MCCGECHCNGWRSYKQPEPYKHINKVAYAFFFIKSCAFQALHWSCVFSTVLLIHFRKWLISSSDQSQSDHKGNQNPEFSDLDSNHCLFLYLFVLWKPLEPDPMISVMIPVHFWCMFNTHLFEVPAHPRDTRLLQHRKTKIAEKRKLVTRKIQIVTSDFLLKRKLPYINLQNCNKNQSNSNTARKNVDGNRKW